MGNLSVLSRFLLVPLEGAKTIIKAMVYKKQKTSNGIITANMDGAHSVMICRILA